MASMIRVDGQAIGLSTVTVEYVQQRYSCPEFIEVCTDRMLGD